MSAGEVEFENEVKAQEIVFSVISLSFFIHCSTITALRELLCLKTEENLRIRLYCPHLYKNVYEII